MEARILQRALLARWVDELIARGEVIAPQDDFSYGLLSAGNEIWLSPELPTKSLKEQFFPQREVLFEYALGDNVKLIPPSVSNTPRVIFTRPCEAASLPILDKLFSWEYLDPLYLGRRERTVVIAVACEQPPDTCFCTSVGGSPAGTSGADLLLTPLGTICHVQIVSGRGRALVGEYDGWFDPATPGLQREKAAADRERRGRLRRSVDVAALSRSLEFESPLWEDVSQACVDCGVCTFLCPTCHCFDIRDEGNPAAGCRVRLWDSCAFAEYTRMPVGQPRREHYRRYRQRVMHKFRYYPERFGETLCVGCGRCIRHCPAGMDITQVLEAVVE